MITVRIRAMCCGGLAPNVVVMARDLRTNLPGIELFSLSHADTMVRRRLAAFLVDKGYRRARFFVDEHACTTLDIITHLRLIPELDHLNPAFDLTYVVRTRRPGSREALLERLRGEYGSDFVTVRLSKYRSITLESERVSLMTVREFEPFPADDPRPSAWIFHDDRNATAALDWCVRSGVEVPDRISIIGLENSRSHAHRGISACVKDWDTMGYLLGHALIGDIPLQHTSRGYISYDARMVERQTTP